LPQPHLPQVAEGRIALRRPIGIFEWCVLTQEMVEEVYPEDTFKLAWAVEIQKCLRAVMERMPKDAIERGEHTLQCEFEVRLKKRVSE